MSQSASNTRIDAVDSDDYDELDEDSEEFQLTDRLPAPGAMMYHISDLHKLMHLGEIDLSPPYQRDVVWPESKQIRLIDSLYHNYYIPPLVFAIVVENGYEIRRCVDGKQRLTSIQRFIDGEIPYRDPITKRSFWFTVPSTTMNRREIPHSWKEDFAKKLITCIEYRDLARGFERDIFQRVQLGIPLTAAEKLQAISSPWAEHIAKLTQMRLTSETGIADQIQIDTSRGRDFQAIAQFVYCCDGLPEERFPTATKLEHWLQRSEPPALHFKEEIKKTMQMFQHMASTPELRAGFTMIKNRVAPVEFVFIGVLLYVMRGCDYKDCAQAILDMRQNARNTFKDIRTNSSVVKFLWSFIARVAEEYDTGVFIEASEPKKPARKGRKRSRKDVSDGEDMAPPSTSTKTKATKSRLNQKSF